MAHIYKKYDIKVSDDFITKFAEKYIEQRTSTFFSLDTIDKKFYMDRTGFDTTHIQNVIRSNTVTKKFITDKKGNPHALRNIYRSDLGELLMTYFFEKKLDITENYIIPFKNISNRELADMPGRGLDTLGYRLESDGMIKILVGEAKVSGDKLSPPSVVDKSKDSIYHSQLSHKTNKIPFLEKLSDYCRKLSGEHATIISTVITCIDYDIPEYYTLTFGCCLVRDYQCVNELTDFGLLKDNANNFDPFLIHFPILSFSDSTIDDTVVKFYDKVQSLIIAS